MCLSMYPTSSRRPNTLSDQNQALLLFPKPGQSVYQIFFLKRAEQLNSITQSV